MTDEITRLHTVCPHCEHTNDAHTGVSDGTNTGPQEGDISMCIECGNISRFNGQLVLYKLTEQEKEMILSDQEAMEHLSRMKFAWTMLDAMRKVRRDDERPDSH